MSQDIISDSLNQIMNAKRAKALCDAAQKSIGVKQIGSADRYRVEMCLEEVKRTVMTLKNIDMQLKRMLKEIPSAPYLMSIPGIGPLSAAVFLGEIGDSVNFHNARQLVKYAGYDPQESDSDLGSDVGSSPKRGGGSCGSIFSL